jgi:hypothetical protein
MSKLNKWDLKDIPFSELKILKENNPENLRSVINQVINNFWGIINKENIDKILSLQDTLWEEFLDYFFSYLAKQSIINESFSVYIIPAIINTWKINDKLLKESLKN